MKHGRRPRGRKPQTNDEVTMDYRSYLEGISFCLVRESDAPRADGRYVLARETGEQAELLELPTAPLDVANTRLPHDDQGMKRRLSEVCTIPRMSTFAIGSIINHGVSGMRRDQAFVNVGLWNGFTFLCGLVGNPSKTCIGVDNFSQFGGPKEDFHRRFQEVGSNGHRYFDMDYVEYFERLHTEMIGFYIYDGEHSYDNQLRGLRIAEPYFGEDCIVLVDDTNWPEPRQATLDFVDQSDHGYEVLLDRATCGNGHPTWWNGIMVLRRVRKRKFGTGGFAGPRSAEHRSVEAPGQDLAGALPIGPAAGPRTNERNGADAALVSIVIDGTGDRRSLEKAIASGCNQTYPKTEVVVVSDSSTEDIRGIAAGCGDKVVVVAKDAAGQGCASETGFRVSRGERVLFVDAATELCPTAVELGIVMGPQAGFKGAAHIAWIESLRPTLDEIAALIPPAEPFILVDESAFGIDAVAGRRAIPFLERHGQYWGPPPDDETAIREIKRMRDSGASFVVFAWPAFWWLDYYGEFVRHLRTRYRCVLEHDRLVAFDFRLQGATSPMGDDKDPSTGQAESGHAGHHLIGKELIP